MKHEYETNIKCPHCDHEDQNSWEFDYDEQASWECGSCGEEFEVIRDIEVTYSSYITPCNEGKHDYQLYTYTLLQRDWIDGRWQDLKEEHYKYFKTVECSICETKAYPEVSKEEYEKHVKN